MIDRDRILPHRIAALAERLGDRPAVIDVLGPSVTYREFHDEALRWATAYQRIGLGEGQTVVTMLPNSLTAYYAWLGAAWLRALEVPANNMYRGTMLRYLIENSEAEVVVIAERFLDHLSSVATELTRLKIVIVPDLSHATPEPAFEVIGGAEFLAGADPARGLVGPEVDDVAAIIYTSGTTGPSKGVLVPWGELHWFGTPDVDDGPGLGETSYNPYPPFHASGKAMLYAAVGREGTLVIREMFSVTSFWDDVRAHNVTSVPLVGPLAQMLFQMPEQPNDADNPIRTMACAPVIPDIDEFKRRFGIEKHTTAFGMTETGPMITAGWNPPNTKTCGRPRPGPPGYELRVVDAHDQPVPSGQVGELIVRCAEPWSMSLGYWRAPDKTADAWRNGWFHTGDAFMVDEDGWMYFVDRIKDAIRRRGENISSFEVEAGVNEHPAVQESAVVGVPSELGEDDVKAYVILKPGESLAPEELIEFLVPRMARFMIPRYLEFVAELPKTEGTFRTQKVKLRDGALNDRTWDRDAAGIRLHD